ncbi:MAG: hypothetical protein J6U10_00185 [Lachnospiraceae bacterium]|nr:hypothetical protein [Lachnospiraceae bacterium]
MAENILNGGLEVCTQIRDTLKELSETRSGADEARSAAAQADKAVKAKEKAVKDEIAATIKKRKEDLEQSYDEQIDTLKQRTKAVKDEKGKERGEQQAKRIENETAGNRERERELLLEIRSIYKRDGIPTLFNTKLFYALFMPRTLTEILVLVAAIVITLIAIPTLIVFVFMKNPTTIKTMLVYYACVFIFVGLYMLISYLTKSKFRPSFVEILKLRKEIRANRRDMRSVSHRVQRDKDDSKYDLEAFDVEMERIKGEVERINEKKKEALKVFENDTKNVIASQLEDKNRVELDELRSFVETRTAEEKRLSEHAKELGLFVTSNFEPFIDKADLTVPIFDRAVAFMENGRAATVSEALELAKNPDVAVAPEAPCEPAAEETGDSAEPAAVDATEAAPSDETPFEASSLEAVDSVHEVLPEAQSPFDGSNQ